MVTQALADTSIFIGREAGRYDTAKLEQYEWAISAITMGELRLGVISSRDSETATSRLSTYQFACQFEPLPIDEAVTDAWAALLARLRAHGRKMPVNDSWIAATALAHEVPLATQDADYDKAPGLTVIKF